MNITEAIRVMLPPFALCVLMVGMLSYLGIHVIKREIIFVDLALAQIAALGALLAFLFGIPLHTQASYWFSMALTVIAAAIFTLTRTNEARVPQEAVIGLVYAIAAGTAIIVMDKAPHGAQHIKDILTGSILWVQWRTVGLVALVYSAVGLFHFLFRRRFLLISDDAEAAHAQGINVRLWDFLFYLTFGFVITVSVGSAGVLLVFVFLVAPAVMAVLVTNRLLYQLLFGWIVGLIVTVVGLAASLVGDLSSGPVVIGAYAIALILVAAGLHVLRASDRARALRQTLSIALGFAVCFGLLVLLGRTAGSRYRGHAQAHADAAPGELAHHETVLTPTAQILDRPESPPEAGDDDRTGRRQDDDFAARFEVCEDPADQAVIVCDALQESPATGAALALRYLKQEPPLFFAQTVVEALDSALGRPTGFDVEQPFTASANQTAAQRVRADYKLP